MLPRHHPDRLRIAFDDHRLVNNAGLILPATLARRSPELVHSGAGRRRPGGRYAPGSWAMPRWPSAQAPVARSSARTPSLDRRRNRASTTRVSSNLKMGESSKMELTHPKVAASSAGALRRCVKHIAEGGRSERDPRDERSGPFDPGDCPGAGRVPQHGTPVPEVPGGHASQAAAAAGVEAGPLRRAYRPPDGGRVVVALPPARGSGGDSSTMSLAVLAALSRFRAMVFSLAIFSSVLFFSYLPCGFQRGDAAAFSGGRGLPLPVVLGWFPDVLTACFPGLPEGLVFPAAGVFSPMLPGASGHPSRPAFRAAPTGAFLPFLPGVFRSVGERRRPRARRKITGPQKTGLCKKNARGSPATGCRVSRRDSVQ